MADPDQMPCSVASDLGQHNLQRPSCPSNKGYYGTLKMSKVFPFRADIPSEKGVYSKKEQSLSFLGGPFFRREAKTVLTLLPSLEDKSLTLFDRPVKPINSTSGMVFSADSVSKGFVQPIMSKYLRETETDTPGSFSSIFNKVGNFCDFLFGFLQTKPVQKRGPL